MQRLIYFAVVVFVAAAPFARAEDAAKARQENKKMEGTWKPVTAEIAGKPFPEGVLKTMSLVIADGKYTVTVGEQKDEGTVKLDPTKDPHALDIVGTKGPNKGKTILAIYKVTDTTLRVCYDLSGQARPTEFKTRADTQLFLVEYKRQKP